VAERGFATRPAQAEEPGRGESHTTSEAHVALAITTLVVIRRYHEDFVGVKQSIGFGGKPI